jgi:cytochrome P450
LEPDVSPYAQARAENLRKFGFGNAAIGKLEIANIHVAVANAIPIFFWLLLFIVTDPQLKKEIRAELSKIVSPTGKGGKHELVIDITNVSESCPLLLSAYQETLRLTSSHIATRFIMEDTILSDGKSSFLLRKGATVQMPSGVMHNSTAVWGPNAGDTFDARRFLKTERSSSKSLSEADKEQERLRKRAFAPFGGGIHLCPGRHFAFAETLGTIAVLTVGYEITTKDGGLLPKPASQEWKGIKFAEAVAKPYGRLASMGARIRRRQGFEDVIWSFKVGGN